MPRVSISKEAALILLEVLDEARNDGAYVAKDGMIEGYIPVISRNRLCKAVDEFELKLKAIVGE